MTKQNAKYYRKYFNENTWNFDKDIKSCRLSRKCDHCRTWIEKGQSYRYTRSKHNDIWYNSSRCRVCTAFYDKYDYVQYIDAQEPGDHFIDYRTHTDTPSYFNFAADLAVDDILLR